MSCNVFICYRRIDFAYARGVWEALSAQFGPEHVFMDVTDIRPGDKFAESIKVNVERADVVVAVISPGWLDRWIATGDPPRTHRPEDFVRIELSIALERGLRIIPVLVGGAVMPGPDLLPSELSELSAFNALELSDLRWRYDTQRLTHAIKEAAGESNPEGDSWRHRLGHTVAERGVAAACSLLILLGLSLTSLSVLLIVVLGLAPFVIQTLRGHRRIPSRDGDAGHLGADQP